MNQQNVKGESFADIIFPEKGVNELLCVWFFVVALVVGIFVQRVFFTDYESRLQATEASEVHITVVATATPYKTVPPQNQSLPTN